MCRLFRSICEWTWVGWLGSENNNKKSRRLRASTCVTLRLPHPHPIADEDCFVRLGLRCIFAFRPDALIDASPPQTQHRPN